MRERIPALLQNSKRGRLELPVSLSIWGAGFRVSEWWIADMNGLVFDGVHESQKEAMKKLDSLKLVLDNQ